MDSLCHTVQVNSETLKEVFSKVGKVGSAVVMRDQSGASRGFGFVNFTKPEEAEKAIQQFNKVPHTAGTWLVSLLLDTCAEQHITNHDCGVLSINVPVFLLCLWKATTLVLCLGRCVRLRRGSQS